MKKALLLSLSLVLGFSVFAQQRLMKNDVREGVASAKVATVGKEAAEALDYTPIQATHSPVVNRGTDQEILWTTYDLQSNQFVANRMVQWANGNVAAVATMSHEANLVASDRGTGYNFFDGSNWGDEPETRVEPWKTGWPSIAQYKENGEILLAHGNGHMQCFIRETAGQGDWTYVGALPDYPEGYAYTTEYPTWPRIVTCGDNHNIAVAAAVLQHSISNDETDLMTVVWRSENPSDISSWTISYGPLEEFGWNHNQFSADDYCMAANGHNVALVYSGCLTNSVWLFKSTDDGLNWESSRIWENPYEGREFDEEPAWGMEDTLFMPMNSSVVIDNNGVVHVAMNTFEMAHTLDNEPGYYTYYSGRAVDGILYWNDTQEAPMQSPDGNPHHAARLWWPSGDGYVHMEADSTRWIGYLPMYEDETGNLIPFENDKCFREEYHSKIYGLSGHPVLSCDPNGNLACAFSSPNTTRLDNATNAYYLRSIYVSYYNVDEGYWHQIEDDLTDDFTFSITENLFTISVLNTINVGEFWFGFQSDEELGFAWGSSHTQAETSPNSIQVCKVIADPTFVSVPENSAAQDVVYRIYPNPATDRMVVSSAMDADATVTIYNLVGQVVKQFNKHLNTGENTIGIDLKSGVYFCTVSANGFDKTVKVVVK